MFKITREKHLDHMVKVVPFIVGCYAFQCYVILSVGPGEFARIGLSVLGGFLACMIGGFVTYDLKHEVEIFEDRLKVTFLNKTKTINFSDIVSMEINEPGQSFATLTLKTNKGQHRLCFIDDAEKVKTWIEDKREVKTSLAA